MATESSNRTSVASTFEKQLTITVLFSPSLYRGGRVGYSVRSPSRVSFGPSESAGTPASGMKTRRILNTGSMTSTFTRTPNAPASYWVSQVPCSVRKCSPNSLTYGWASRMNRSTPHRNSVPHPTSKLLISHIRQSSYSSLQRPRYGLHKVHSRFTINHGQREPYLTAS
jgi:hypothetical protein